MTGRRVLSLVVGLWTASAAAQNAALVQATASFALDAGLLGPTRAYVVTGGDTSFGAAKYAIANAGGALQVFDLTNNVELTRQDGVFSTFAVADFLPVGATTKTLVVAADVGPPSCTTALCLDIFFWDQPTLKFVAKATAMTSLTSVPTAMAIDATSSPIRIFFATQGPATLYEQDITINGSGTVIVGGNPLATALPGATGFIQGLTVDGATRVLYFSDNASNIYTLPEDAGVSLYAQPLPNGYSQVRGLSFFPFPVPPTGAPYLANPYLLAGSGLVQGVYALSADAGSTQDIVIGSVAVLNADAGRFTQPTGAAVDGYAQLTLLSEDYLPSVDAGGTPWIHVIAKLNLFPDGGPPDAGPPPPPVDAGFDAGTDAGGLPTIPIIAPGPGVGPGPTNSCNCSTAGSAPVLLALLLPLLVPRRRR